MVLEHIDVGIDIGQRRLAFGWPHFRIAGSIDLGKELVVSRDHELRTMQAWLNKNIPSGAQLWIDQAFAQASVAVAQRLTETIAAVLTAQQWTRPPIIIHSGTWKSQVVGNHRASKAEIRDWLEEHHPELARKCLTEDETDSMVIGLYGRGRTLGEISPPDIKKAKRRR